MEFLANHVGRHQQVAVLKDELAIRYAKLQMQYEALHKEMLYYKTRANYWEAQFNKFKSREDELKAEIEELKAKVRKREQQLFGKNQSKEQAVKITQSILKRNRLIKRRKASNLVAKDTAKEMTIICQVLRRQ